MGQELNDDEMKASMVIFLRVKLTKFDTLAKEFPHNFIKMTIII